MSLEPISRDARLSAACADWLRDRNARVAAEKRRRPKPPPAPPAGGAVRATVPCRFRGVAYPSLRAAARATGENFGTVRTEAERLPVDAPPPAGDNGAGAKPQGARDVATEEVRTVEGQGQAGGQARR